MTDNRHAFVYLKNTGYLGGRPAPCLVLSVCGKLGVLRAVFGPVDGHIEYIGQHKGGDDIQQGMLPQKQSGHHDQCGQDAGAIKDESVFDKPFVPGDGNLHPQRIEDMQAG